MDSAIRLAALEHHLSDTAEALLAVQRASYREEARLLGVVAFPPLNRTVEQVQAAHGEFFGCWRDGRLEAVAEVSLVGVPRTEVPPMETGGIPRERSIDAFTVHPRAFRQGLGSRLLAFLLQRFGAEGMTVSTAIANLPAIALYQSQGFSVVEEWRNSHGFEMVRLRRGPAEG